MLKKVGKIDEKRMKSAGAGAKCDHFKLSVRTHVRAHLYLDVRGACVRPKKGRNSHLGFSDICQDIVTFIVKVSKFGTNVQVVS